MNITIVVERIESINDVFIIYGCEIFVGKIAIQLNSLSYSIQDNLYEVHCNDVLTFEGSFYNNSFQVNSNIIYHGSLNDICYRNVQSIGVVITEVTHVGHCYCIAGYNIFTGRRIRPKSFNNAGFWTAEELQRHQISCGSLLSITIADRVIPKCIPHDNDNFYVTDMAYVSTIPNMGFNPYNMKCIPYIGDLKDCFHGVLQHEKFGAIHIDYNTKDSGFLNNGYQHKGQLLYYPNVPSLMYFQTDRFRIEESYEKHYLHIDINSNDIFRFKLTGTTILPDKTYSQKAILCLGLAQPWTQMNCECYMQCNNIIGS